MEYISIIVDAMSIHDVKTIIALWPTRSALAGDIDRVEDPVLVDRVHKWAQVGSIPPKYHGRIIRAARRRGLILTAEDVVAAHDMHRFEEREVATQ